MKPIIRRFIPVLCFAAFGLLPASAQVNIGRWLHRTPIWGSPIVHGPFSVSTSEVDAVSGSGGGAGADLHLEFPIHSRALPNRAQINAVLVYDSMFWGVSNNAWQPQTGAGWWLRTGAASLTRTEEQDHGACGWTDGDGSDSGTGTIYYFTFTINEPDGSSAFLGTAMESSPATGRHNEGYYWDCPTGDTLPESFSTSDGKGFSVTVNGTYSNVTGTAYDGYGDVITSGLTDPNGNTMSATGTTLNDALGTAVWIGTGNPVDYTYVGPGGVNQAIAVHYTTISATAGFGCYTTWSGSLSVPSSIVYPDGSTYSFSYDSAGRLASVTYPGGGVVYYSHLMSVQCSPPSVTESFTKTDSLDGANQWKWLYQDAGSTNETVQTDPSGNTQDTWFDANGNTTSISNFNGFGQQMKSVAISGSIYNRTWTTSLNGPTDMVSAHTVVLNGSGFPDSVTDTGWGNGVPGTVLQTMTNGYTGTTNGIALTSSIVDDNSLDELSKTTWTVDSLGNPLTESHFVNNSTALTTTFTNYANGTVHTLTEPNGAVTTFGYTCGTGYFPSSVQTVVGTTTATWDCNGAAELSATDLNGHSTTTAYDTSWRPTQVTRADGTTANFNYPASANSFALSEQWISSAGVNSNDTFTTFDPLGRPTVQQVRQSSGGSSFDSVQTCYDPDGRPDFVTTPYSASLSAPKFSTCPSTWTAGGTFTTFDGLSRPLSVEDGGGGVANYTYYWNDVEASTVGVTGGPTTARQDQFDSLGRLQSVCEITASSGTGGNWPGAACVQNYNNAGTLKGYTTTYAYNYNATAQGPVTVVTQNAQSGNPALEETRTQQLDQLGRVTSETNPESGTTHYYYDSQCGMTSAGDLMEKTDANGNGICYTHDAAHRVTEITYGGPNPTDNKFFVYGTAVNQSLGCCTLTNVFGQLAEAYTGSPSSHKTDTVFGYSPLGQMTFTAQATPNSAGWVQSAETYSPGGSPASLALQNGAGANLIPNISYTLDGEGRIASVSGAAGSPPVTATAWLPYGLNTVTFGSTDGHTDTDTYTLDANTGRMTGYSFSVDGATDAGTLGWLANGELSSLAISDAIAGTADNGLSCSYTHDDMGRISLSNCGTPSNQTFTFDPFGNVCKTASSGTTFCPNYNTYNQIAASPAGAYDANGNLLNDPTQGSTPVNTYDAENKPVGFEGATVTFDALGRAVEATRGPTTGQYVYAPDGSKLAVMSGQTLLRADVPLPGGAEAVYDAGGLSWYRHAGALGSSRLATRPWGALYSATAYAPFGEPIAASPGNQDRSFTGNKQDIANGQSGTDPNGSYDFLEREYSPTQSRWWTPDPAGAAAADPSNPQSFNRYAYVNGSPLEMFDPLGLDPCMASSRLDTNSNHRAQANGENFGPYDAGDDSSQSVGGDPGDNGCYWGPIWGILGWINADLGDLVGGSWGDAGPTLSQDPSQGPAIPGLPSGNDDLGMSYASGNEAAGLGEACLSSGCSGQLIADGMVIPYSVQSWADQCPTSQYCIPINSGKAMVILPGWMRWIPHGVLQRILRKLESLTVKFICGSSPGDAVQGSVQDGVLKGAGLQYFFGKAGGPLSRIFEGGSEGGEAGAIAGGVAAIGCAIGGAY